MHDLKPALKLFVKHHKRIAFAVCFLLLFENSILLFDNIQNKTPIIGLRVFGTNVTTYSRKQIEELLRKEFVKNQKPLKLSYQDKTFTIQPADLAATVDYETFANKVLTVGRKGNVFQKIITQNKALIGLYNIPIEGKISPSLLTIALLDIQKKIDRDALPNRPDIIYPDTILPSQEGVKIQVDKLTMIVLEHIFNASDQPLPIPTYKVFPNSHSKEEIAQFQKEIKGYSYLPISISSGGFVFTLSTQQLQSMLKIAERPDPKNPKKSVLVLRFDEEKLNRLLGEFAEKVENVTRAEFDHHDATVGIFSQFFTNTRRLIAIPTGRRVVNPKVLGIQTKEGQKTVYLTFDDGPNSIYHPLILDILKTYHVPATFFLVGQNAKRDMDIAKRTVSEGHMIGNHSFTHAFLPNYRSLAILNELTSANAILKTLVAYDIGLFRPPYGGVNTYVTQTATQLGMKIYLWDVDPRDWSEPETEDLVNRVVNNTFDGADILLHSNHLATVKALPKIIEKLQAQGYIFKTL